MVFSKKFVFLILFITIINLVIDPSIFSRDFSLITKIIVVEGNLACFDIPKEFESIEKRGETAVGRIIKRLEEYICLIKIENRSVKCYVPEKYKQTLIDKLLIGAEVYLIKNIRKEKNTNWDIISVASSVGPLQAFSNGIVSEAKISDSLQAVSALAKEQAVITEQANVTKQEQAAIQEQTTSTIESSTGTTTAVPTAPTITNPSSIPSVDEIRQAETTEDETFPNPTPAPQPTPSSSSSSTSSTTSSSTSPTPSSPTIDTSSLANGTENVSYTATLSASSGTTPYSWSVSSGSLPTGLSLSSGGVISGTPTTRGTYSFTVKVTDNNSQTATKDLSIKIGYYQTGTNDYVWIANNESDNVTPVLKSGPTAGDNVTVNTDPWGIAVDDTYVWVTNSGSNNVTRITKADTTEKDDYAVGFSPYGVAVDETNIWVANGNQVTRITKSDETNTDSVAVGNGPRGIAVDETYAWVASYNTNKVYQINKSTVSVENIITVGSNPIGIAVDDTYVWVANYGNNTVSRITKSTATVTATINVEAMPPCVAVDNTYVWVSNASSNSVTRITKADTSQKTTVALGGGNWPVGVSVDSTYLWVCNDSGDTIKRFTKATFGVDSPSTLAVGNGPLNVGDATGYSFDMFFQGTLVDPAITGRIYNSSTNENVTGAVASIYQEGSTTALQTSTTNPYSFNVLDGKYYIRVEKSGYTFPSNTKNGITAGDHGEVFTASGTTMSIDIPLDQGYPLEITKTANKQNVVNGDIITYDIKIRNNSMWSYPNVNIIDDITNGFKYVTDSTYTDNTQFPETNVSQTNRKATFKLTNIPGYKVTHLSYQVRVGSGISPGEYKTKAVAWDRQRDWQMSNETKCQVNVILDALFTLGTIIGKTFNDTNGNGIQDKVEKGIPNVRIATEYGVVVETDRDGKYHIAAVPPGTHLLKVDKSSLPTGNYKFTTENPYLVKITDGLLAKVNFGIKEEAAPKPSTPNSQLKQILDQFFIVALGEGVVRNISTKGNIKMVEEDDTFEEGVNVDGKLALYLKGKIKGKYLVTASVDTDRRPSKRGKTYQMRKLFTNLDPDKYYPVYGDASKIDYSANDTQDELYLLVQWDKSRIKYGAFTTDIPLYSRTIQGANIVYENVKQTKFGDPYTKINTFYARAYQIAAHDEFLGTGGSLYYIRHTPLIEGSEKVRIELRDQVSKEVIGTKELIEQQDYEIDYTNGKIILKKPLTSVNYNYTASIISSDILSGSRAYLVIDYEYENTSSMRKEAYGIKANQWVGSHVNVGGTYVEEQKESKYYKLMGGDSTIKINKDTEITAEYDRSEQTQLSGSYSIDGGLSYDALSNTANDNKSGSAFNIKGKTRLFNNTDITAGYTRQDANFSATNTISTQGSSIYTGSIYTKLKENVAIGLKHVTQQVNDATLAKDLIGNNKVSTTTASLDYLPSKWDIRLEYQHQTVDNPFIDYTYAGFRQLQAWDIIGGRIGYKLTEKLHPYIGGQITVQNFVNNQGYVGLEYQIWDNTYLRVKETQGNLGNSTQVGLVTQLTPETEAYTNIEVGNNSQLGKDGRFTKTTTGQKTKLDKDTSLNWEKDYSSYQSNILQGDMVGYEKKLSDTFSIGLSYERAFIEKEPTAISRDSGSIALTYLDIDHIKAFSKLELRQDRGAETNTVRQWLTTNNILYQLNQDISLLGKANWSISDNRTENITEAQFHEMGIGMAYRPVNFDKLNFLAKYSYITNQRPDSQDDFFQLSEDIRNIYSIEGAYDMIKYLQLVAKFAMRDMREKVGPRDWTDSETYLAIGRLNFHITNKWDLSAEYRTLANRQIEDSKSGWLFEIDRELVKYVNLGVGYNFTDYDDDLANDDNYDASGWFVRVNGKY